MPSLIAEILSDSTRHKDTVLKLQAYQNLKVPYYLIVDPESSEVVLHTISEEGYRRTESQAVYVSPNCSIEVNFGTIFEK